MPRSGEIDADDSLEEVVAKITHADARSIDDTARVLDIGVLAEAVEAVLAADWSAISKLESGANRVRKETVGQVLRREGDGMPVHIDNDLSCVAGHPGCLINR